MIALSWEWKQVKEGIKQGNVSGPYLFNIFMNDSNNSAGETLCFKCTDDYTINNNNTTTIYSYPNMIQ